MDDSLSQTLDQLAALLHKRDDYAALIKHLLSLPDHPNKRCWLAAAVAKQRQLQRQIDLITVSLTGGYFGQAHIG